MGDNALIPRRTGVDLRHDLVLRIKRSSDLDRKWVAKSEQMLFKPKHLAGDRNLASADDQQSRPPTQRQTCCHLAYRQPYHLPPSGTLTLSMFS